MKYFNDILMGIFFLVSNSRGVIDLARNLYFSCLDLLSNHMIKSARLQFLCLPDSPGDVALAEYHDSHKLKY